MNNVLIMVHDTFSEKLLKTTFSNKTAPQVNVVMIPHETACIDQIESAIKIKSNMPFEDFDYAVVESNYGSPASTEINSQLLSFILNKFTHAKVIAYSGTAKSLTSALKFDERIYVLPKGNEFINEVKENQDPSLSLEEIGKRTLKMSDLRNFAQQNAPLRRSSCPYRLQLTQDAIQTNVNKVRCESAPALVTPHFQLQSDTTSQRSQEISTTFSPRKPVNC